MEKITFVIPSRNNLEFLQLAYKSIRKLNTVHEILVLNDGSKDGTFEWIEETRKSDTNLIAHHNLDTSKRIGIVGMFDKGIQMSKTDIIMAFHADMIAGPKLDENILKHLERGKVVSATRVEPPLHPPGPEKITMNFHIGKECEAHNFDWDGFYEWAENVGLSNTKTTEGIFAPWCMYKEDFLAIGGHDELFAPQSKEDSDLFNRMQLAGYKFVQPWNALVYHFTSRGSRFNKHAGGAAGKNSQEWLQTTTRNGNEFIRKWGHFIKHDAHMKPIIPPKYDIGISINNCTYDLLKALEPWCSVVYTDYDIPSYVKKEQINTRFDLLERIRYSAAVKTNDILIEIDGNNFNNEDYRYIQNFAEILANDKELEKGSFQLGNLQITINSMKTYEIGLIL